MPAYNVSDRSVAYVRDRVQTLMACTVSIYESAEKVLDTQTGRIGTATSPLLYRGKARIWESNTGQILMMGETAITLMQTNISIPFSAPKPKRDQIVVVNVCPQDPDMVGRAFRVVAVDGGGQIGATRRMTVTAFTDSDVWSR